ncbi:hypothetical protein RUND412_000159 [Rhizina undulata]
MNHLHMQPIPPASVAPIPAPVAVRTQVLTPAAPVFSAEESSGSGRIQSGGVGLVVEEDAECGDETEEVQG